MANTQQELTALEASSGGRLGISAIDTGNNNVIQYHANQRFPMGCTSKVMGVAAILKKSMSDNQLLQERVFYHQKDILAWAPITKQHLADGMTIQQLSAAAISYSDNTAMNLLAEKVGGPPGINTYARSIGDNSFELNNWWPKEAMSNSFNGTDSSTPAAMQSSLQKLVLGNALAFPQRQLLQTWLIQNTTGNARIRAGTPKGWLVGDKTGTGDYYGTANDIGIIWPPHCAPIVVAIFYTSTKKEAPKGDAVIAKATRIILNEFEQTDQCIKQ
ncbi:MAG: class A beta-lactamase [Gammaproteobacteria bacterium]|nr:class A beta-lactamase [Gammaproteobacteria bacterium]